MNNFFSPQLFTSFGVRLLLKERSQEGNDFAIALTYLYKHQTAVEFVLRLKL
jgi:hypothetical protein